MIIIEEDMKLGTKRKVTFMETYRNLLITNRLTKVALNYLLLSNIRVMNDRLSYRRQMKGVTQCLIVKNTILKTKKE